MGGEGGAAGALARPIRSALGLAPRRTASDRQPRRLARLRPGPWRLQNQGKHQSQQREAHLPCSGRPRLFGYAHQHVTWRTVVLHRIRGPCGGLETIWSVTTGRLRCRSNRRSERSSDCGTVGKKGSSDLQRSLPQRLGSPLIGDLTGIFDEIVDVAAGRLGRVSRGLRSTHLRGRGEPPGSGMEPDCTFYIGERADGFLTARSPGRSDLRRRCRDCRRAAGAVPVHGWRRCLPGTVTEARKQRGAAFHRRSRVEGLRCVPRCADTELAAVSVAHAGGQVQ